MAKCVSLNYLATFFARLAVSEIWATKPPPNLGNFAKFAIFSAVAIQRRLVRYRLHIWQLRRKGAVAQAVTFDDLDLLL